MSEQRALRGAVFVTGANGFLGSAVLTRCEELGLDARGVDLGSNAQGNVVAGDISDPSTWSDHLAGCDTVVHTAAVVTNNVEWSTAWNVNVVGTRKVLEAAAQAGVKRFVYISTMGVARHAQVAPEVGRKYLPDRPLDETWPLLPVGNPYADTKIAAEHVVLAAHGSGEMAGTIIRPADIYGPRCRPWVVEPVLAIKKGMFLLPKRGTGLFTAAYIEDLVDAILAAAATPEAAGNIFHVGGEEPVTTNEYFGHFYRMLGLGSTPRSLPTPAAIAVAEAGRIAFKLMGKHTELGRGVMEMLSKTRAVSNTKAHEILGWWPKVSLAEGMALTEEWLRSEGYLSADS